MQVSSSPSAHVTQLCFQTAFSPEKCMWLMVVCIYIRGSLHTLRATALPTESEVIEVIYPSFVIFLHHYWNLVVTYKLVWHTLPFIICFSIWSTAIMRISFDCSDVHGYVKNQCQKNISKNKLTKICKMAYILVWVDHIIRCSWTRI